MTNRAYWNLCLLLVLCSGCQGTRHPFSPPGTMRQQQLSASVHDPYADADAGPEVVGGRPREFQKPLAEPVRSRFVWDQLLNR